MFYELIPLRQFRTGAEVGTLTYAAPKTSSTSTEQDQHLTPGTIVEIPLGKTHTVGIVAKATNISPTFPTKPISRVLYNIPLPHHLLKSIFWLSDYYLSPLSSTANLVLPPGITKSRRTHPPQSTSEPQLPLIDLNPAQKQALKALQQAPEATKLLHGVTGSGKTNIYLKMALDAFKRHLSTILLVPEIALTSQLVQIFEKTFGQNVILIHSRQTESTRHQIWERILAATYYHSPIGNPTIPNNSIIHPFSNSAIPNNTTNHPPNNPTISNTIPRPLIVIGPRSALFAPLHNLGLIIIDEAHEATFYQDTTPRYSALRLASYITSTINQQAQALSAVPTATSTINQQANSFTPKSIPITQNPSKAITILGTATPLIADYYLAHKHHSLIPLTTKAKSTAITPTIKIIDLRNRNQFNKNRYFSDPLLAQIAKNLKNHYQTLIFHNRRGSAPLTICTDCGWQALCPTCFLPLTLHTDSYQLICHTCGYTIPVPHSCPSCGQPEVIHKGFGTKLLAEELKSLFPKAKIARFDADNAKNDTLDAKYDAVKSGEIDLIVGTQTVTKGLDLPQLASVGVVQADAGLALPDYAAEERTFHLLTQVIGRVGRGHLPEASCFIQTYQPDHPVIQYACRADYSNLYQYLLKKRRTQHFPPFSYLAKISITYKTEATTLKHIQALHRELIAKNNTIALNTPTSTTNTTTFGTITSNTPTSNPFLISAPTPAFHEHTPRGYTWQLILRATSRTHLLSLLKSVNLPKNTHITLDPPSLL